MISVAGERRGGDRRDERGTAHRPELAISVETNRLCQYRAAQPTSRCRYSLHEYRPSRSRGGTAYVSTGHRAKKQAQPMSAPDMASRREAGQPTPRNQTQETAFLMQIVLKLRFLVLDFGVWGIARGSRRTLRGTVPALRASCQHPLCPQRPAPRVAHWTAHSGLPIARA
eukprot:3719128-Rhodomonas_salina.2